MTRPPAERFQDLIVWQKGHQLVLSAEGFKKRGRPDKARHMNIAQSSLEELRYYFILCGDLSYLKPGTNAADIEEVARLLGAYARTLLSPDS